MPSKKHSIKSRAKNVKKARQVRVQSEFSQPLLLSGSNSH
jgi:hypothetical protein